MRSGSCSSSIVSIFPLVFMLVPVGLNFGLEKASDCEWRKKKRNKINVVAVVNMIWMNKEWEGGTKFQKNTCEWVNVCEGSLDLLFEIVLKFLFFTSTSDNYYWFYFKAPFEIYLWILKTKLLNIIFQLSINY